MVKPIIVLFPIYTANPNTCTVHLINDGVTVDGGTATVEFASTGPTTTFQCSVDGQSLSACELVQDTYTLQLVYCEDF